MPALLPVFGLVALAAAALWWLRASNPAERARRGRLILGGGLLAAGAVLSLRGGVALGVPVGLLGLGLLGVDLRQMGQAGEAGPGGSAGGPPPRGQGMSRDEACELLGLDKAGPLDADTVNEAYRSLMKRVHPDVGGSDGLARALQQARDILLGN